MLRSPATRMLSTMSCMSLSRSASEYPRLPSHQYGSFQTSSQPKHLEGVSSEGTEHRHEAVSLIRRNDGAQRAKVRLSGGGVAHIAGNRLVFQVADEFVHDADAPCRHGIAGVP